MSDPKIIWLPPYLDPRPIADKPSDEEIEALWKSRVKDNVARREMRKAFMWPSLLKTQGG